MMIVTGHTGKPHVTSDDDRALYAGIFGKGSYVLNTGTKLGFNIESSNTIRIESGDIIHQGTHARIPYGQYTDVSIDNGTTGFMRADLIVARYEKIAGIETMSLMVLKGNPAVSDPVDPDYIDDNILEGADESDMPLYRVNLNGVNINSVEPLFTVYTGLDDIFRTDATNKKINELKQYVDKQDSKNTADIEQLKKLSTTVNYNMLLGTSSFNASSKENCEQYQEADIIGTYTYPKGTYYSIVIPQNLYGFSLEYIISNSTSEGTGTFKAHVRNLNNAARVPSLNFVVLNFGPLEATWSKED